MVILEQRGNKFIRLVLPNGELLALEYIGERSDGISRIAMDSTTEISIVKKKLGFSMADQLDTAKTG
jgi:hypothetical protein